MGTTTKNYIAKDDLKLYDGSNSTFTRKTSSGGTATYNTIDWAGIDIFHTYGEARTLATINSALKAVGSSNKVTFWLSPGEWTITDDVTITSNITLSIPPGASLALSSGKTLTIHGPLVAGINQIFSGTGSVAGSPKINHIYPQWFGALADGSTDDTTEVQYALDMANN